MSRTRTTTDRPQNPAKLFLRWDSGEGTWGHWDKEAKKLVTIPVNTPFIYLDALMTATGYSDDLQAGIYANEVRSVNNTLRVMAGKKEIAEGNWAQVKAKNTGAKFATSLYALAKIDGEYMLVNFKLSGCSLTPWIDFEGSVGKQTLEGGIAVGVTKVEDRKKGKVEFRAPVFGVVSTVISDDADAKAFSADETLQSYLDKYFDYNKGIVHSVEPHEEPAHAEPAPIEPEMVDEPTDENMPF